MMIRKNLFLILFVISFALPASQAQKSEICPIVEKYFLASKQFFKNNRQGVILAWFESYRDPNRGVNGEYHIELHRGFRFEFIRRGGHSEDALTSLTIVDPTITLPLGLKIGDTKEKVKQIFGEPTSVQDNHDIYIYDCYMSGVSFKFSRNKLIEASAFFDHD